MRAFWKFCTPPGAASMWRAGPARRVDDELRRRPRDARALARADLDQAHLAQVEERLAHGGPADAELPHQIALGRKLVGRRVVAVVDHPLQMFGDVLVELAPPDELAHGIPFIPARMTVKRGLWNSDPHLVLQADHACAVKEQSLSAREAICAPSKPPGRIPVSLRRFD